MASSQARTEADVALALSAQQRSADALTSLQAEHARVQSALQHLKGEHSRLTDAEAALLHRNDVLTADLVALQARHTSLSASWEALDAKHVDLCTTYSLLDLAHSRCNSDLVALSAQHAAVTAARDALLHDLQAVRTQIAEAQTATEAVTARSVSLEAERMEAVRLQQVLRQQLADSELAAALSHDQSESQRMRLEASQEHVRVQTQRMETLEAAGVAHAARVQTLEADAVVREAHLEQVREAYDNLQVLAQGAAEERDAALARVQHHVVQLQASKLVIEDMQSRLDVAEAVQTPGTTQTLRVLQHLQGQLATLRPEAMRLRVALHSLELELQESRHESQDAQTQVEELRAHLRGYESAPDASAWITEIASVRTERDDMLVALKDLQRTRMRDDTVLLELDGVKQQLAAMETDVTVWQTSVVKLEAQVQTAAAAVVPAPMSADAAPAAWAEERAGTYVGVPLCS